MHELLAEVADYDIVQLVAPIKPKNLKLAVEMLPVFLCFENQCFI